MADFNEAIKIILAHEGGYVEHQDDPGGATNWGISLRFAQSFNPTLTKEDIRGLARDDAINLYFEGFWEPNRYEEITCSIIATKVFDICVNAGARVANEMLQKGCNNLGAELVVDGICGSGTIAGANSTNCVPLIEQLRNLMREFYQNLAKNKGQQSFINGWLKRADW